jgi:transposase InsO family protein
MAPLVPANVAIEQQAVNLHDPRDYVRVSPRPDAETVKRQLPAWIAHYNEVYPHKALGYCSPREFIAAHARP